MSGSGSSPREALAGRSEVWRNVSWTSIWELEMGKDDPEETRRAKATAPALTIALSIIVEAVCAYMILIRRVDILRVLVIDLIASRTRVVSYYDDRDYVI